MRCSISAACCPVIFYRHKPHRRSSDRFANHRCVGAAVLVALHIGFDIAPALLDEALTEALRQVRRPHNVARARGGAKRLLAR
jgi:hypothetical protein